MVAHESILKTHDYLKDVPSHHNHPVIQHDTHEIP